MDFPDRSQHKFRPTRDSDISQYSIGMLQTGDRYFNIDPIGKIYDLCWVAGSGSNCPTAYSVAMFITQSPNSKMTYYSSDGTFRRLENPVDQGTGTVQRWTIFTPDGSRVTNGELDFQGNVLYQTVYDQNNDFVTQGNVTLRDGSAASGFVDQFGRYVAKKSVSAT